MKSHGVTTKKYEHPSVIHNPEHVRKIKGEHSNPNQNIVSLGLCLHWPKPNNTQRGD